MPRAIHEIAADIRKNWKNVSPHAQPYLDAMGSLTSINDMYYADTASEIVARFRCNAGGWRGPEARRIKEELAAL